MTQLTLAPNDAPLPSTCTLYQGNCLEIMPTLTKGSVAMVFADLPYGVTQNVWDAAIDLFQFWKSVHVCQNYESVSILTATQPFASTLILSNKAGFKYDLVWHKTAASGHLNAARQPLRAHEHVLIFRKKPGTYNPQMMATDKPRKKYSHGTKNSNNYGAQRVTIYDCKSQRFPRSVITFASREIHHGESRTKHPTQKPVALLEWLVKTYTNEGDTVLDPVMGSGTTGVACARLGRNFIGIEKDAAYFEVASKRIADERARLGLG